MSDPSPIAPAGGWEITLLEVGTAIHPGQWVGPGQPEWMWSPVNALLLRGHGQTVLVDAGSGVFTSLWPFEGISSDLPATLEAAGASPADIDLAILTHLDDDHIGGLLAGAPAGPVERDLPRARVVAPQAAVAAARLGLEGTPQRILVDALHGAGVLTTFPGDGIVAPGIRVRDAPGHRVGHAIVEIADPVDPFVHLADALHHRLHVASPEWDREADTEPDVALETRRALIAELADTGARAVASHIPGPRAFRVVRGADGAFSTEDAA